MMVVVMRRALTVMMVMYLLAWGALWETILSSVQWSKGVGRRNVIVWLVMMMVVMMTTELVVIKTLEWDSTY
jgi:hypothetical protein